MAGEGEPCDRRGSSCGSFSDGLSDSPRPTRALRKKSTLSMHLMRKLRPLLIWLLDLCTIPPWEVRATSVLLLAGDRTHHPPCMDSPWGWGQSMHGAGGVHLYRAGGLA
jgi:hypothetical protein